MPLSTHEIYTEKSVAHTLSQVAHFSENRWHISQEYATNGEKAKIVRINHRGVALEIDGKEVTISRDQAKESLALGGVHTGDSAQGQTWERAVVVLTGMETREWLYSALTRGRNAPVIVVLSDEDEPAQSVVEKVLAREGISKTVEEMCKTDATLAESVRRAREGDLAGDPGGQCVNDDQTTQLDQATDELSESHQDPFEHKWEKNGSEQIVTTTDNDLDDEFVPPDDTDGGYFIPDEEEPEGEYERYEREPVTLTRNDIMPVAQDHNLVEGDPEKDPNEKIQIPVEKPISNKIFGTWSDTPSSEFPNSWKVKFFRAGLAEKIRSGEIDFEAANEALRSYRSDKSSPEQSSLSDETKPRQYGGGFFYKDEDGIWVVDCERRDDLWRKVTLAYPTSTQIPALFDITSVRKIQRGGDETYYPNLDLEMVAYFAREKAEDDAYYEEHRSSGSSSRGIDSGQGKSSGRSSGGYGYGTRS